MLNGVSENTGKNMSFNSQKSLVRYQDTLSVSMVQESGEDRPVSSSGRQSNVRGFHYDDTVEAWQKFLKSGFNPSGSPG